MVQFLVRKISKTHLVGVDADKDLRGCIKKYDIYQMQSGDFTGFGKSECLPHSYVLKCDITETEGKDFVVPRLSAPDPITGVISVINKWRYQYDFDTHLTEVQLQSIADADWLVLEIDKNDIEDKAGE